jgi:hypothetical protein
MTSKQPVGSPHRKAMAIRTEMLLAFFVAIICCGCIVPQSPQTGVYFHKSSPDPTRSNWKDGGLPLNDPEISEVVEVVDAFLLRNGFARGMYGYTSSQHPAVIVRLFGLKGKKSKHLAVTFTDHAAFFIVHAEIKAIRAELSLLLKERFETNGVSIK